MYTEDEAREKWCPHARDISVDSVGGAANRYSGTPDTMCIGSACMAWRWSGGEWEYATTDNRVLDEAKAAETGNEWLTTTDDLPCPPGNGWEKRGEYRQKHGFADGVYEQRWRRRKSPTGYCGLSGSPYMGVE